MDVRKAAADMATYQRAAEEWTTWADKLQGDRREEALRKALVYRANCARIEQATDGLVKAFMVRKRIKWKGLSVSIEHPAGSLRKWHDDFSGESGATYMFYDYGYLRSTEGVDGDAVDVFMGPQAEDAPTVFVIRQMRAPDFRFYDEDKCMIGFTSADHARRAYLDHYNRDGFLGRVDAFPVDAFVTAVRKTKRAPAPVGGWETLLVPQRLSDSNLLEPDLQETIKASEGEDAPYVPAWRRGPPVMASLPEADLDLPYHEHIW